MNEVASFYDGDFSDVKYSSKLNNPPYAINNQGSHKPLMKRTLQPDAVHYGGLLEYDVHNLYGRFLVNIIYLYYFVPFSDIDVINRIFVIIVLYCVSIATSHFNIAVLILSSL